MGKRTAGMLLALAVVAGCAKGPDSVAPVSMAGAYDGTPCDRAGQMLAVERQRLLALEKRQRNAAAGDAIGVFLILVPVSSITGNDVTGELATSKGKVLALEQRTANCR